ncbi:transposon ty3-I gag-pol polyprotein [Tanacetum coccineum]
MDFRRLAVTLVISINNEDVFTKYVDGLPQHIQTEMRLHTTKNISQASSIAMAIELKNKSSTQKFEESSKGKGSARGQSKKDFKKIGVTQSLNENIYCSNFQEADKSLSLMTKQKEKASNMKGQLDEKEELFTLNIQVKQEVIEAIVNMGSQKNLISATLVQKLGSGNVELITTCQARRLVNASQVLLLILLRPIEYSNKVSSLTLSCGYISTQFENIIAEYHALFDDVGEMPPNQIIEHDIQLVEDSTLPKIGMYRNSVLENNEIKRQVEELLESGVIRPSSSLCGSPIVLVPKKDGGWRMCVDYRALNKITIKNRYPLPRIDDLLDQLKKAMYFTKLDLKSGYHQVRIREEDTWKTAFKTRQGLYEWRVMPFGLCNAPATFMRLMNDILRPHIDDFVIVYLDDILIYSCTWEDHLKHVRKVFHLLQQQQLRLNRKKCEFGKKQLTYLGFVVGNGELQVDPDKVKAITSWPRPRSITDVRSFLGACQYLRKFICHFSVLASPLHAATKLNTKFEWSNKHEETFLLLKRKISEAPVLALPNLQRPFELETDASGYAMGAVLYQEGRPIAYHSEMFQGAQKNYPTYDKELFALHQAVKHWRCYLLGKETVVHTDHQPLQYLQSQAKLQQARHMKWMTYLQQFNLVIKYKKGSQNKLADMLSRPPVIMLCLSVFMQVHPSSHNEYASEYPSDPDFMNVIKEMECHKPTEFNWKGKLLYKGGLLCVPKTAERVQWMREAHTSKVVGHFGVTKTLQNLQRYVFWPRMHQDVNRFVKGCILCSTSKPSNRKVGLYTPLPVPSRPWESISMDFLGGLPKTRRGNDYLFVIVDRFSKMVVLIACKKTVTGEEAARLFFENVWKIFGLPKSIISDRDSRFLSNFWCSLWSKMDTKLKRSTTFHPQTDGQTEVVNHTVVHLLRGYNSKHPKTWDESIPFLQFAINHVIHSSTGKSPFEVCLGFLPQTPFDLEFTIEEQLRRSQQKYKERRDRHRVEGKFQEGDLVWLHLGKERLKVNVDKLKLFEPSMLDEEPGEYLPSLDELINEQEKVLTEDTIVERKSISTRCGERKSYRIGMKGQLPSKAKWFSKEVGETRFPHL